MKVLIVYDSVSPSKVTKAVAEIIEGNLKEKGIDVDTHYFAEVDKSTVAGYDCIIAGAPTMAFRMSKGMGEFLDSLKGLDFKGKRGAGFDTQMARFSGNAAKGIENRLVELGFTIFKPHLVTYVSSKGNNEYAFKEGETEKAKGWAQEAAKILGA